MANKYSSTIRIEKRSNWDETNVAITTQPLAIHLRLTSQSALFPASFLNIGGTLLNSYFLSKTE